MKALSKDMLQISAEQQQIRADQGALRIRLEAIEQETIALKRETGEVVQQSARTQVKLALMFNILKAREEGNWDVATQLTTVLRRMVEEERQNAPNADDGSDNDDGDQ